MDNDGALLRVSFCLHPRPVLTYADDAVRANQLDEAVLDRSLGVTLGISVDVAEVTDVTGVVSGSAVGLAVRVDFAKVSRELRILVQEFNLQ